MSDPYIETPAMQLVFTNDIATLRASHERLLKALESFVHPLDSNHEMPCCCRHCDARAAIEQAKGIGR